MNVHFHVVVPDGVFIAVKSAARAEFWRLRTPDRMDLETLTFDNHTFTLSTLGNLSDCSFITRFDYSLMALTHLRFEAFVSARYGHENGEFRCGVSHLNLGGIDFTRAPALMDLGIALRIAI